MLIEVATCSLVPNTTSPLLGSRSPRISLSKVLLPEPFGPMMPTRSPRRSARGEIADNQLPDRSKFTRRTSTTSLPDNAPVSDAEARRSWPRRCAFSPRTLAAP